MHDDPRPFHAPVCLERALSLLRRTDPDSGGSLLDVGCGRGSWALHWLELGGQRVLGVDPDGAELDVARDRLASFGERACWLQRTWVEARDAGEVEGPFEAALAIGASHAFADGPQGARAALEQLAPRLAPGGRLLLGDLGWARTPEPEFLAATGLSPADLPELSGLLDLGPAVGLSLEHHEDTGPEEWEAFERGTLAAAEARWAGRSDDPRAQRELERRRAWFAAHQRWGRDTLGFRFLVLRRS